jgi:carboxyl-terminal processing protease
VVIRARIVREIVSSRMFKGGIGYLSLAEFTENAATDIRRALRAMNANTLNGLILDLRSDPGGGLQTAIDIASQFLRGGTVVIQRGRTGTNEIRYPARGNPLAPDVPMVVLVNESSASASELVSGALQDRGRAKVVGTNTFRKGSIQQWQPLSNGGGIRVTIAEFFKPSGATINHIGIIPDVVVPWNEDQARKNPLYDPQLTEALWMLQGKM